MTSWDNLRDWYLEAELVSKSLKLNLEVAKSDQQKLAERVIALIVRINEYENAISWNTTCLECSKTLDKSYAEYVRADKAERALERVKMLRDDWKRQVWTSSFEEDGTETKSLRLTSYGILADMLDEAIEGNEPEEDEEPS